MTTTPSIKNKVINCPILIATSNLYLPLLKPFAYLFNEFWSPHQPVTFLGYEKPNFDLPDNFVFHSMGVQRGIKFWSEDIRNYLLSIECDYFAYTAEDMFLARPVNFASFRALLEEAARIKPARFAIGNAVANQKCQVYSSHEECDFARQDQISNYRLSLTWSIWRKDYFLKHLHPNYSPWDFEVRGMAPTKNDGETIIGCHNNFPLGHCNAMKSGGNIKDIDFDKVLLNFRDVCSHRIPNNRKEVDTKYINKMVDLKIIGPSNKK